MCRKDRWKINLGPSTSEGDPTRGRGDSISIGSETAVQELALQMGGQMSNDPDSETEVSSFKLYAAEDKVPSTEGSGIKIGGEEVSLLEGAGKKDDEKIAAMLRRFSLYSFERLEIKE